MARSAGILGKQSKYGFRQGVDELHLDNLMPDIFESVRAHVCVNHVRVRCQLQR